MKKLNEFELAEIATPSGNPDSGYINVYAKSDGRLYKIDGGVESIVATKVFNVLDYVSPGYVMGTTDATAGIQAAINACHTAGGGVVYFPNGTYIINGALQTSAPNSNSQIYIPAIATQYATDRLAISLMGESSSTFPSGTGIPPGQPYGPISKGVILKSTITTGATGAAVIGTAQAAYTANNQHHLTINNLTILVEADPAGAGPVVGGINWRYGYDCRFNNLAVSVDVSGYDSVLPTNLVSGIELPDNSAGADYNISNSVVIGFRSGFKISEHVVLNNCNAMCCYYGIDIKEGHHSTTSVRTGVQWCAYNINISGYCTLSNFTIDAEWQDIGKWYDAVATINDPSNLAKGQVFYTIVAAGVGVDNTKFAKIGGANLHAIADEVGVQARLVSGTNLKTINSTSLLGSGNIAVTASAAGSNTQLQFNNSGSLGASANLTWDGTHLAIGGGSPANGHLSLYQNEAGGYTQILFVNGQTSGGTPYGQMALFGSSGDGVNASTVDATMVEGLSGGGLLLSGFGGSVKIGIGNTRSVIAEIISTGMGIGGTPVASAKLELASTTQGFLPPRMTKTQRDAISSPANGLTIYQTDNTPGLRCFNGTNWMRFTETAD